MKNIDPKNFGILNTLLKYYEFSELNDALKIIRIDLQRKDGIWNWAKTKLRKKDYWIFRSVVEKEGYLNTKEKLELIERLR